MKERVKDKLEKRSTELIVLTAIIAVGGAAAAVSGSSDIMDSGSSSGLVAEYRFDTGAGDTVYDTAGENDGLVNGASWTEGVEGKALSFDGSSDYVASSENLIPNDQTGCGWIKTNKAGSGTSHWELAGILMDETGGVTKDWGFGVDSNGNIAYGNGDGSNDYTINGNQKVTDGNWHHVCFTRDKSSGDVNIYVDGRKDASGSAGTASLTSTSDDGNMDIGRSNDNGAGYVYFSGKIDRLSVYSKTLNGSQIKSLYNRGSWRISATRDENDPSNVLDMNFQYQNSSHVLDTSGYDNHGQPQNGASQESAVNCKVGRCYSFDGNDNYAEIEESGSTPLDVDNVTMMAWIKTTGSSTDNIVFNKEGVYEMAAGTSGVSLAVDASGCSSWCDGWMSSDVGSISSGEWAHVTTTWNGDVGKFYINGVLLKTTDPSEGDGPITDSDRNLGIGARDMGGSVSSYFNGRIDEAKIFNRSLSQQEIIEETKGLQAGGTVLDLRFNGAGGDKAYDHSTEDNHASLKTAGSTMPEWKKGVTGTALNYKDGAYADLSNSLIPGPGDEDRTLSLWVKMPSQGHNTVVRGDLEWGVATGGNYGSNGELLAWNDAYNNGSASRKSFNIGSENIDKWTKVTLTWDHSSSLPKTEFKAFVNGDLQNSWTYNVPFNEETGDLKVGDGWGGHMTGSVDNLKIYPYALKKTKVKQLYSQEKPHIESEKQNGLQEGLVLSQTFDSVENCVQSDTVSCPSGMSGRIAVDESSEANHGELVNGPKNPSMGCKVGACLSTQGAGYAKMSDSESLNITEAITVSSWVKFDSLGTSRYVSKYSGSEGFLLQNYQGDSLQGGVMGESSGWTNTGYSWNPKKGEWYHTAFTYDRNRIRLYVDGEIVSTKSFSEKINPYSGPLTVGSHEGGSVHDGSLDQLRIYNRSLSKHEIWKLYSNGRDRSNSGMAGPVANYPIQIESSPLRDVSGEGNHGDLNLLGESGTFNTSDGEWKTIRFDRSYGDPVVVGTSNTHSGEAAIYFEARNVQSHKADMRLCESEGGDNDGCDSHGTERAGYIVVDAASTDDIPGIEAGSFENTNANGDSFTESFSTPPLVFTEPQTDRGEGEVASWTTSRDTSGFNVQVCDQDSTNGCTSPDEEIGWIAVEPGNEPFEQPGETNNLSSEIGSSNWGSVSFSSSFSERPVGVFSVQNNDGGQDPKVDEIRNVDTSGMEMRFCELETGDTCDGHASMEYGYLAVSEGLLKYSSGNFPRYVETERGKALKFDGSDDYIEANSVADKVGGKDVTLTYWMKTSTSNNRHTLSFNTASGGNNFLLGVNDGYANTHEGSHHKGSIKVNDGEWHFHAVTVDISDDRVTQYVDGKEDVSYSSNVAVNSDDRFSIGQEWDNDNPSQFFPGSIDDVRVYPYALNREQVKQVMNSGAASVTG